jgi:hypothetical protein
VSKIKTACGPRDFYVEGAPIKGTKALLAVTREVIGNWDGLPSEGAAWKVTHVPTGYAFSGSWDERADAEAAGRALYARADKQQLRSKTPEGALNAFDAETKRWWREQHHES